MSDRPQPSKRLRGVILSPSGWQRLQVAKLQSESQNNAGTPYTLEQIVERTGLSHNTLTKVHHCKDAVDRQTLDLYFKAFGLSLQPSDFIRTTVSTQSPLQSINLHGPIPVDSQFYIERFPIEMRCDEAVLKLGALIRIKAPRYMGKTSLMIRILNRAREKRLLALPISLRLADTSVFQDLDHFLRWCCEIVTRDLELPSRVNSYWDDLFGSSYSCTHYFEKYLLAEISSPLVLAFDDVDVVFRYPEIATSFLGLLRAWYEKARYGDSTSYLWQKLRLVVIHSTEVYIPLKIDQSPFNVGLSVELPEFTSEQVQFLVHQYGLDWTFEQTKQLTKLIGGNPNLVQLALTSIGQEEVMFEELTQTLIAPQSIYTDHLRRQLIHLQQYPELVVAFTQVVTSPTPIELEVNQAFRLQSLGLVKIHNRQVMPSCQLYRQFFSSVLPMLNPLPKPDSDMNRC